VPSSLTKYNSVILTLARQLPTWVTDDDDAVRVAAYDAYEDMFRNVPGTFLGTARGEEDPRALYIPSSSRIVEATNRYLGKSLSWDARSVSENVETQATVMQALADLFKREEFISKYYSLKRNMLVKGDAVLSVTADLGREAGKRLTISEINPRNVFKITSPDNQEEVVGYYIVDLILVDGTTQVARRLQYQKLDTGKIFAQLAFFEPNAWDDRWDGHPPLKQVATPEDYRADPGMAQLLSGVELPPTVTALPIYHVRNKRAGGEPYGTSQLAGIETVIGAINQGASDEDITLALQGLGIYVTDSTAPVNAEGELTDWIIQPGYVLEMKNGKTFQRVDGVKTVVPFQDHLKYLGAKMDESAGLSATAVGHVDAAVVASGVALRLDMAPILAQNEEKETELLSKLDQFLHDLVEMWLPVEGVSVPPGDIVMTASFGDPLPVDRAGTITEVTTLVTAGLMSKAYALNYLSSKLGFSFPPDMLDQVAAEADAVGARVNNELNGVPA
jgi:hypothetical protein